MGIQGLLPQLKSIMVPIHAKDLRGQSVAVDTYSWLHKGALSCSRELCKGLPTTRHIDYCMHRVNLLRHYGVKPILVFDGGFLPMKVDQETKRSRARKENLERAFEHESTGNLTAAYECYQKAVDISPAVAFDLIQVLKQENVDHIVAPYEADAQMTYLILNNHVDAVITEDSDLIPFGCSRIIFKMDKFGQGLEFQWSMLCQNKELRFTGFSKKMFLEMCILSGCDYLQSLPGMGLKRAHALIQKFKSYDKVIKHLRFSAVSVPPLYEECFKKAMLTFQHQRVYDPTNEDIVHLSIISEDLGDDYEYLGPWLPQSVVKGISKGELDPFTKMPLQENIICSGQVLNKAYPVKEFVPATEMKRLHLPVQKNVLTNYFCLASLEAKRKFRAPQIMRKHSVREESSPCSKEHVSVVHSAKLVACTMNCSKGSLVNSGNSGGDFNSTNSEADDFASETNQLIESKHEIPSLQQHSQGTTLEPVEENTGSVDRMINLTSSSFKSNLLDDREDNNINLMEENEDVNRIVCENTLSKGASHGNDFLKNSLKKRRPINSRNWHGKLSLKQARTTTVLSEKNNLTCEIVDKNGERKFPCDISHLSHYAGVAEKSMDRFVSLISSFRYTPSGSRASGLRAPLKDVLNTRSISKSANPASVSRGV